MSLNFSKSLASIFIIIIFTSTIFYPISSGNTDITKISSIKSSNNKLILNNSSKYSWPTPGYTKINSFFGKRNSPTLYASSYHLGIDIAAPSESVVVAVHNATVKYTGFYGSGGYTIILGFDNLEFIYHHMNPNFLVSPGMSVECGEIIGYVGPKNVYGIKNNPYKDSFGNPTNRCNYWSTFTFWNKKRRLGRQSFKLFLN